MKKKHNLLDPELSEIQTAFCAGFDAGIPIGASSQSQYECGRDMSINLENPETLAGKIDAALNYLGQLQIAIMAADFERIKEATERANGLLVQALQEAEIGENKLITVIEALKGLIQECEYSASSGLPFNFPDGKGKWTQLNKAKELMNQ